MNSANGESDELYEHFNILVDAGQVPLRIDRFLLDRLPKISRTIIQAAIKDNMVFVNGKTVKNSYKVKPGDQISGVSIKAPSEFRMEPEAVEFGIEFEDESLLVVNKPSGIVVHPGHGNYTGTLVHGLFHYLKLDPDIHDNIRPGLVHRIDKETSGLMVIAKTEQAMTHLAKQFYDHKVYRRYQALVWGEPDEKEGSIEGFIGRNKRDRKKFSLYDEEEEGKWSKTHYKLIESYGYVSLLEFRLETGRTHQIRVHCSAIKHPIFNDSMYGGDRILRGTVFSKYKQFVENCFKLMPRQALHAKSLGFIHPQNGEQLMFESDLPSDFESVLLKWKKYVSNRPD